MKGKITKRSVERITPLDRDVFLWDTEVPMFGCKITPKGRRVYMLQYRHAKRLRRYTIGVHGDVTAEEARREAIRLRGLLATGTDPGDLKDASAKAIAFSDLAERYLSQHAGPKKKKRSLQEDTRLLSNIVLPALGQHKIVAIKRGDVARLHHSLRDTPYQANRVLALLNKMFNLAEAWGLRPDGTNPCRHAEKFKEHKRERYLSVEEMERLGRVLADADADGSEMPSVITAIRLLLLTGARLSEILTLRWDWVDFERGALVLPDSKTGAKIIPLNKPMVDVLESAKRVDGNPHVIPGMNPGAHLVNLNKPWRRIRERAGLSDVRLHDLRHSFASIGAAAGLGLPIIGALLGHTQPATTARYAHLANDPLKAASEEIGAQIAVALNKQPRPKVV